jgi:hypothetical protein
MAYDLRDCPDDLLDHLRDRTGGQLLVEHATCWTDPPPLAADVTGLLGQRVVQPWGERLAAPAGGEPHRIPPDERPAEVVAAELASAAPPEDDEVAPGDTDADLLAFAAAVGGAWPPVGRLRDRLWSWGPVRSSYFN